MFCQHCGNPIAEAAIADDVAEVAEVAEVATAEVQIAEINASRDIALAKISAGMYETETEVKIARAEARAEVAGEVAEAIAPEAEGGGEPVVVVNEASEPEAEATDLPEAEPAPAPDSEPKRRGYGNPLFFS